MLGPSVNRPYRGSVGPFVGIAGSSPVPTIACPIGSGDSYVYDPFDRIMGWWNYNFTGITTVTSGQLRTASNSAEARLLLFSRNPVGAEIVTLEASFTRYVNNGITRGGWIRMGGYNIYAGYYLGADSFVVTTASVPNPPSGAYTVGTGYPNNTIVSDTLRMEVGSASTRFFVNGALVYTLGSTLPVFTSPIGVGLAFNGITTQYAYCDDFVLYGYGLPVICA